MTRTMSHRRARLREAFWPGIAVAILLGATACGGASEPTPDEEEAAAAGEAAPTEEAVDDAGEHAEEVDASAEVEAAAPRLAYPGAGPMELLTPAEGGGPWPELAWAPVDGAARYEVLVYAASGRAYWSWRGTDASVRFGGFSSPPDEASAVRPRLHEPMTWSVLARDADGEVIAQSGERPIAP